MVIRAAAIGMPILVLHWVVSAVAEGDDERLSPAVYGVGELQDDLR